MLDVNGVGSSLKAARLAAGLTQIQMAERLRVSQSTVSDWERKGRLQVGQLYAWAHACGVQPAALLLRLDRAS